jgi:hypothetical protein
MILEKQMMNQTEEDDVFNFILFFIYSLFVLLSTSKIKMLIKFIEIFF